MFNKCFLTIRIPQNLPPKSRKWHLGDSRFKNAPGTRENVPGTRSRLQRTPLPVLSCPRIPLAKQASARLVTLVSPLILFGARYSLAGRTFLACNILVKIAAQNLWRAKHELSSMVYSLSLLKWGHSTWRPVSKHDVLPASIFDWAFYYDALSSLSVYQCLP